MPIELSPQGNALVGAVLCLNGLVTIYAAVWRPAWLDKFFLRGRWFNSAGPRAGRFGTAIGAIVFFVIGAFLINTWARVLTPSALGWTLALCFFGLIAVVGPRL